jgi:hypothetical protein
MYTLIHLGLGTLLTFSDSVWRLALIACDSAATLGTLLLVVLYLTMSNVAAIHKALAGAGWVFHTAAIQAPLVASTVSATILGALAAHE